MRAEFDAVKARLASVNANYKVYDGLAVDESGKPFTGSYYVLYGGGPDVVDDGRFTKGQDAQSDRELSYTVRCVSPTAQGARVLAELAFAQLVGWTPTVAGRRCRPIRHTGSDPATLDSNVLPAVFYADDDYELISARG